MSDRCTPHDWVIPQPDDPYLTCGACGRQLRRSEITSYQWPAILGSVETLQGPPAVAGLQAWKRHVPVKRPRPTGAPGPEGSVKVEHWRWRDQLTKPAQGPGVVNGIRMMPMAELQEHRRCKIAHLLAEEWEDEWEDDMQPELFQ